MSKINVLVVPSDTVGGVGFYRSIQPHLYLEEHYPDDFSITIDANPKWDDLEGFKKYDIIHIHKGLFTNMGAFMVAMAYFKNNGIVTVMDIDDHWRLGPHHPSYASHKRFNIAERIKNNFKIFDYITTTTPIFANEIKPFNKNVYVFPNAINPRDERFTINRPESSKIRIGLIMGAQHEYDMRLLTGLTNRFDRDTLSKIELVLCGFDTRGTMKIIGKDGSVEERPIKPDETVWFRYENILTDGYKIVSPEYKEHLMKALPDTDYEKVEDECYHRYWTKDINHYYQHYNNVDILLAPLETTDFNKVKSQLKAIECCFAHTALIASDFGPYQLDLINLFEKGGTINENGNAVLINENKNHSDWYKAIKKLVDNPELITKLQDNLYNSLHEKYDLKTVCAYRAEFYKTIINKKD